MTPSLQIDAAMEEDDEENDPLAALCNECEEAEKLEKIGNGDESDGDYEEVDEFDSAFSVFGSEEVIEKKVSLLGKRQREYIDETAEEEMCEMTNFSEAKKTFLSANYSNIDDYQKFALIRPMMRR